jgi:hypothetical protein
VSVPVGDVLLFLAAQLGSLGAGLTALGRHCAGFS